MVAIAIAIPASAMSNEEFAQSVQQHLANMKQGKGVEEAKSLCPNLSMLRRQEEPKCVAYERYEFQKTTGPNKARIRIAK